MIVFSPVYTINSLSTKKGLKILLKQVLDNLKPKFFFVGQLWWSTYLMLQPSKTLGPRCFQYDMVPIFLFFY